MNGWQIGITYEMPIDLSQDHADLEFALRERVEFALSSSQKSSP